MPEKRGLPKTKAARVKKPPTEVQVSLPDKVEIHIDLGPVKAKPEQIARLKHYLENQILTWVKFDLGSETVPTILSDEFRRPPVQNNSDLK
jgi:hypothetical protein